MLQYLFINYIFTFMSNENSKSHLVKIRSPTQNMDPGPFFSVKVVFFVLFREAVKNRYFFSGMATKRGVGKKKDRFCGH